MTTMRSFYVGPGRPPLAIGTWSDLAAAADAGVLIETQWVECKQAVPVGAKANLELAKDLASCSVDGGVVVIGAVDKSSDRSGLVGVQDPEGVRDRISQVCTGRIRPPLNVDMFTITEPEDGDKSVLLVVVPASADAPHMVDERYWGRSATGKRALADTEVRRLLTERGDRRDEFLRVLRAMPSEFDPIPEAERRLGHLYLYARPSQPPTTSVTAALTGRAVGWLAEAVVGQQVYQPTFRYLNDAEPHPDGFGLVNYRGHPQEDQMLRLLLDDAGGLRLVSGNGTRTINESDTTQCINVGHVLETTHQTLRAAARVLAKYVGYYGPWDLGVHITGLRGLYASYFVFRPDRFHGQNAGFAADTYTRTTTAFTQDLLDDTASSVRALLADFARGVNMEAFFPYSEFAEIGTRLQR